MEVIAKKWIEKKLSVSIEMLSRVNLTFNLHVLVRQPFQKWLRVAFQKESSLLQSTINFVEAFFMGQSFPDR